LQKFVDVILPLNLKNTYTYEVDVFDFEALQLGTRVFVPFGKSKIYTAIVFKKHIIKPEFYEPKMILNTIDDQPIVSTNQMKLWQWMAGYYMCSFGDLMRAALPNPFLLETETKVKKLTELDHFDASTLTDDEYLVFEALQTQNYLKLGEISQILNKKNVMIEVKSLLEKKIIELEEEVVEKYKPKQIRYVKLNEDFEKPENLQPLIESLQKTPKQLAVVMTFFKIKAIDKKPILPAKLYEMANTNAATVKKLLDKNIFEEYYLQVDRVEQSQATKDNLLLSEAQQYAFDKINDGFKNKSVALLKGVTSSGKTEIYIKLILNEIVKDKQVLFLVPEIALTTQLVLRLKKYFGEQLLVYHSKYSANEKVEIYKKVFENSPNARVIIGVRSAIFLPFTNLGLVIIDEEHESNFKQSEPAPRYHARDTAIYMSTIFQSNVLLGSATPSIESYSNALQNKYHLVELNERFGDAVLPKIHLINLKETHFRKQMIGHFSTILVEKIQNTLANGKQVIIFQNRRGYSSFISCNSCGHVPFCPNCDVSLTHHKFKGQLRCHYCGYHIAKPHKCHSCDSKDLDEKGFGTEQIELELVGLFPKARVLRMDQDTTRGKYNFDKIIHAFEQHEVDILVGTQMVAKGLDFKNVSLVGVLNADNLLFQAEFRAYERTYQMLTQVAGRTGRSADVGEVFIQTYNPDNVIYQHVINQSYELFFQQQMIERQQFLYPPFHKIIRLTFKHKNFETTKKGAEYFTNVLTSHTAALVLGPEEPTISKVRNLYIRHVLVKISPQLRLSDIKWQILQTKEHFEKVSEFRSIKFEVNVDF
jgi:primosomal protein N' (replication factor Y)